MVQRTAFFAAGRVLTRPPELHTLVPVGEAHAAVAIGPSSVAQSPIDLVRVEGAERGLASAIFWEVTGS